MHPEVFLHFSCLLLSLLYMGTQDIHQDISDLACSDMLKGFVVQIYYMGMFVWSGDRAIIIEELTYF